MVIVAEESGNAPEIFRLVEQWLTLLTQKRLHPTDTSSTDCLAERTNEESLTQPNECMLVSRGGHRSSKSKLFSNDRNHQQGAPGSHLICISLIHIGTAARTDLRVSKWVGEPTRRRRRGGPCFLFPLHSIIYGSVSSLQANPPALARCGGK